MKRHLTLLLVASLFFPTLAASDGQGVSYTGFTVNYCYQDVHTSVDDLKAVWDGKADNLAHGFNVGFYFQQNLYKGVVLVTGVQYQFTARINKNLDLNKYFLPGYGDIQHFNHNIIVPLKFGYSITFDGTSCFTVYAGPSLNFVVSTMHNLRISSDNYQYTDFVSGKHIVKNNGEKKTTTSQDFKRMGWFDIPMGLGAVVRFGRYGLHFEYEWGLVDRWKESGKFRSDQLTAGLVFAF